MSNNLVAISKSQLPAHLRKGREDTRATNSELATGVTSSFPLISYRGKVWRIRKTGEEVSYLDANGDPVQSIELVFVKSNPRPSKTFYDKKYEEGMTEAPRCWSSDGLKPDAGVKDPINNVCATCPKNQWGSRITEAGKKGRACSDVRRMAVVFLRELAQKGEDAHLFLMRIPPASLNPLKDYAEKALDPAGIKFFELATRVGFDPQASHPKLTFRPAMDQSSGQPRFLTEEELEIVHKLRDSEEVHRILSEEPEYAEAGTTGADEAGDTPAAATAPQKDAPAPAKASKQKPRPVEEEDVEVVVSAPPVAAADEDEEDEPPPPVKPVRTKKAPKPSAPVEEREEVVVAPPAAAPAKGKEQYKDILDALLG